MKESFLAKGAVFDRWHEQKELDFILWNDSKSCLRRAIEVRFLLIRLLIEDFAECSICD